MQDNTQVDRLLETRSSLMVATAKLAAHYLAAAIQWDNNFELMPKAGVRSW